MFLFVSATDEQKRIPRPPAHLIELCQAVQNKRLHIRIPCIEYLGSVFLFRVPHSPDVGLNDPGLYPRRCGYVLVDHAKGCRPVGQHQQLAVVRLVDGASGFRSERHRLHSAFGHDVALR
ncbi:hypothetical protein [Fretibacterium fastidiosum]|uniref:hypothetical protein n=1 Tax=Fretibacterium fastidiosum TaxID=651822 RepID=UPI001AD82DFC|nr:hypothetical protein [Fretibacterium fastidiosum]